MVCVCGGGGIMQLLFTVSYSRACSVRVYVRPRVSIVAGYVKMIYFSTVLFHAPAGSQKHTHIYSRFFLFRVFVFHSQCRFSLWTKRSQYKTSDVEVNSYSLLTSWIYVNIAFHLVFADVLPSSRNSLPLSLRISIYLYLLVHFYF